MRIQDTDRILKESRNARRGNAAPVEQSGLMTRTWKMISHLPEKVMEMFHR